MTLGRKTTALTITMNMNTNNINQRNELVLPSLRVADLSGHLKSLLIVTPYVTKCTEKKINTFPENLLKSVVD